MSDFFSYTGNIIKDIRWLDESTLPDKIYHRKNQINAIARSISQYLNTNMTSHLFLYGPPGTGKTTSVKYLFERLSEETKRVKGVYVNCWKSSTGYSVMLDIASQLSTSLRNVLKLKRTFNESYAIIEEYLDKAKIKIIVALDEVDKLEDDEIIYLFARDSIPLIMISNNPYALKDVDDRVKSSLIYESVEFNPYSIHEMEDILEERWKKAFYEDAFPKAFIKVCAANARGDARIGIGIMRFAALNAEKEGKDKVEREDILKALEQARKIKVMQILSSLKREHEIIYDVLEKHKEMSSKELFEEVNKIMGQLGMKSLTDRTFRNYMQDLTAKGLVESRGDNRWRAYRIKV